MSCATISTACRFEPSSPHSRHWSRPVSWIRSPFENACATTSARLKVFESHTTTSKKFDLSPYPLLPMRRDATLAPLAVERSSGSRVRFPLTVTLFRSAMWFS
jgi:hypothetical protein